MRDQKCPNLHPEFSVGGQKSCKRRGCSSCLSSHVTVGQKVIPNQYLKILSILITCPDSLPFQVVIWQAPPCLDTHPMFPQLDKAATQHQLLQEWFLVSECQPSVMVHTRLNGYQHCKSFHSWLGYCFADMKHYSFHKETIRYL